MRKRIVALLIAVLIVLIWLPKPAFADTGAQQLGTTKTDVSLDAVNASADDAAATLDGCAFALGDFARASVGSNRDISGSYRGYAYYIGTKPTDLMYLVTSKAIVVHVGAEVSKTVGIELSSMEDLANLQKLIVALDDANANGNVKIGDSIPWYVTSDDQVEIEGVLYQFNQKYGDDVYDCLVGADGSDVTDTSSAHYTRPGFCCFASLVAAENAAIVAQPTALESFMALVARLDWSPLWVTLKTTLTAIVFIFILGLAAAYFCLHRSPRVRDLFDTIFTIPMVLPPTVCGFLLLLLLGSNTALGRWFIDIGFPLIFSWPATVIAAIVVAFPLMYRNALGAFDNLDPNMLDAARTLGWSEGRIFFQLMLPLSWSSIAAGTVLAFARALGEFGATLFLAGNYLGITRTIPIAIYFEWMNGNTDIALFWTAVILVFSFIVILFINLWSQHTTRYRKGAVEE